MGIFKIKSKIFILAILGLVSGVFGFYQSFMSNVFAEETQFNISLEPAIEIIIPASVELPITPNPSGTMESTSFNILVGTNNITGYTLTMTNSSTELINSAASATIPTLEDNTLKANFPTNRWGYSLDDITYNPIITSGTIIKTTDTNGNATPIAINLATKVNLEKPAGTYTNTINFAAVANALPLTCNPSATTINEAKCMQDMNENVKNSMVAETHYQLADSRDEKLYYIAKLADGNVWMTQNLDYDLVAGQTLTSDLTDLTATQGAVSLNSSTGKYEWTPLNTTQTTTGIVWDETGQGDNSADHSYDPEANNDTTYVVQSRTYNNLDACATGERAQDGTLTDDAARALCTHGNVGNYYNWYAATAQSVRYGDTGYDSNSTNTQNSICPKGWQLPPYSGNKSYYAILITAGKLPTDTDAGVITSPYYIGRAGVYSWSSGAMGVRGSRGYYWESYVYSATFARDLLFYSTRLDPQDTYYKGFGFSVRCVAR